MAQGQLLAWAREERGSRRDYLLERFFEESDPEVRQRIRQILEELVIELSEREGAGFLGINMIPAQRQGVGVADGVVVSAVIKNTPADAGGLKVGDVILRIDELELNTVNPIEDLKSHIEGLRPGTKIRLEVRRGEEALIKEVKLMKRYDDRMFRQDFRNRRQIPFEVVPENVERLQKEEFHQWLLEKRQGNLEGEG
ncbi:MAG: PDZ domain-containing protein [Verrucomicrobiota bacterium]